MARCKAVMMGALSLSLLSLAACAGEVEEGELIELKLGHTSSPGSLISVTAEEFVRRVNEEMAGRVHISLFGSGQLGSDEVLMIKAKLGTVDITLPSTVMSSTVPPFGFFELPYLIRDRAHLRRVEEEIFWPSIAPYAEDLGFEIIALWEHGFRQITNNARPIVNAEDLRGIKLRVPSGYWRIAAFQAFGANPTPMPLTEVFVGLQMGVIDGQENPLPQIYASRFHEVQRYLSLTNHIYSPIYVTVGADRWNRLPQDVRDDLIRIAKEVQEFSYAEADRMDRTLLDELAPNVEINEVYRESFVQASDPVYEQFAREIPEGREWIDRTFALEEELLMESGVPADAIPPSGAESFIAP
jgi:tripartite ATP-independent transporter DctP family solute receptor